MMKKIGSILFGIILGTLIIGIPVYAKNTKFHMTEVDSMSTFSIRISDKVSVWVDDETGVEYFAVFDDSSLNALTPRYNADGSLKIHKDK